MPLLNQDVTTDGSINVSDLTQLISEALTSDTPDCPPPGSYCAGDLNLDGTRNANDIVEIINTTINK
ncbi:MAG: dockerin type I domain-containing protein [Planctomycetota bacterium]